jgi:hypothetical protein
MDSAGVHQQEVDIHDVCTGRAGFNQIIKGLKEAVGIVICYKGVQRTTHGGLVTQKRPVIGKGSGSVGWSIRAVRSETQE